MGHLIIGDYVAQYTDLDQVWFVISPHNPFKEKKSLAKDRDRLHLVHLAIEHNARLWASDVEFNLPQPSYTIDTLTYLGEKYPTYQFALIIGGDNVSGLPKWKNSDVLMNNYPFYVYARPGYDEGLIQNYKNFTLLNAPLLDISSTYIRERLIQGHSIKYLVHPAVEAYIDSIQMYR